MTISRTYRYQLFLEPAQSLAHIEEVLPSENTWTRRCKFKLSNECSNRRMPTLNLLLKLAKRCFSRTIIWCWGSKNWSRRYNPLNASLTREGRPTDWTASEIWWTWSRFYSNVVGKYREMCIVMCFWWLDFVGTTKSIHQKHITIHISLL